MWVDPEADDVDLVIARRCLRVSHVLRTPLLPFVVATCAEWSA